MSLNKSLKDRPFVVLSSATSLDGYIATLKGDSTLSSVNDWKRVHQLRAKCDAIMVGGGTIRADDSKLIIDEKMIGKEIQRHPTRIVVSSSGNIPLNARVISYRSEIPTIIATTTLFPKEKKKKFERAGCTVIECGNGSLVDLVYLLNVLKKDYKVKKLMLEGGGRLNGEMLSQRLIDEIQLTIAPVICGVGVPLFTLPKILFKFSESPFFEIMNFSKIDDMIHLKMLVHYRPRNFEKKE